MILSILFRIKNEKIRYSLLTMKFIAISLFLGIGLSNASVYSQNAVLSLNLQNKTMEEVLSEIERHSEYVFFYQEGALDNVRRVNIDVKDKVITEILDELFLTTGNTYKISDRQVFISATQNKPDVSVSVQSTVERVYKITGRITDSGGKSLVGVTVTQKGTTRGTATDANGNYEISVPVNAVLSFSYMGYVTEERTVTQQMVTNGALNISLMEDTKRIDDVVVTGFVDVNRMDMVGSYESLKMEEIYNPAYTNLEDMLQGQVAGLVVTRTSTRPGTSANLLLRGTKTILGNTSPLWVIDGIEQPDPIKVDALSAMWGTSSGDESNLNQYIGSQISWLNPQDIESVTVLKDASATAIYGSRASNGVIVITTKKAKNDTFSVNFNSSLTINERPTYDNYSLMNSQERINFSKEAYDGGVYYSKIPFAQKNTYEGIYRMFIDGDITEDYFKKQYNYLETVNTDWLDLLTRNAVTQNYNLSLSGGTSKVNFVASLGYSNQEGTEIGSDQETINARIGVNYRVSNKVNFSFNLNGTQSETMGFTAGVNPLAYAQQTSRAIPAMDDAGNLIYYKNDNFYRLNGDTQTTGLNYNILNERDNSYMKIKNQQVNASMNFRWNITEGLRYTFTGSYALASSYMETYAGAKTNYVTANYRGYEYDEVLPGSASYNAAFLHVGGELGHQNSMQESYSLNNMLSYNRMFAGGHRLGVTAGWSISSSEFTSKYNTVWGYDAERGERISAPVAIDNIIPHNTSNTAAGQYGYGILNDLYSGRWKSSSARDNKMGVTMLATYSYKERYVVNINGRNDWSNRFGQNINKRFNPTYSFGLGWNIHNESFLKDGQTWLNELRLTATYGVRGNALSEQSPEMILVKGNYNTLYGGYQTTISKIMNDLLDWEKTKTWDVGIGMLMFNGMLDLRLDGYSETSDAVASMALTPEYGSSSGISANGVLMRNSGFNATINVVPFRHQDWKMGLKFSFGRNWNKIIKVKRENALTDPNTDNYITGQTSRIFEPGKPYGGFWSYSFAGLDPQTGYPLFNHMDLGDDYSGNISDFLVYSGVSIAPIDLGFNLNVGYKSFTLSANMAAVLGKKSRLSNPYALFAGGRMPDVTRNLSKELTTRWREPGDEENTNVPGLYKGDLLMVNMMDPDGSSKNIYTMWGQSDERVVSSSFLRCRSLTFSWFSRNVVWEKVGLKSLTLSMSVNNLFLVADKRWNGMDPELGGTQVMPRSYTFSINLGF